MRTNAIFGSTLKSSSLVPKEGSISMFKLTFMIKLTLRYVRYALSALATIGFGIEQN
jgi:predicted anti-sigma-YlaC factor YlaD